MNQPNSDSPSNAIASVGSLTCQTMVGIGRHCQNSRIEGEAGEKHIRAAFDRGGHELRPPLLEGLSGHDAVLHGKQRHQQDIDDECFANRPGQPVSIVFGTAKPVTKPMAYRIVPRNTT